MVLFSFKTMAPTFSASPKLLTTPPARGRSSAVIASSDIAAVAGAAERFADNGIFLRRIAIEVRL